MNHINTETAWYIAVVMACGFITFYSLPDGIPFLVRLSTMVMTQFGMGMALRRTEEEHHDEI